MRKDILPVTIIFLGGMIWAPVSYLLALVLLPHDALFLGGVLPLLVACVLGIPIGLYCGLAIARFMNR
jgi:hypothetical protein